MISRREDQAISIEDHDAIDSYFECITACSVGDEGVECITQCVERHLKEELVQLNSNNSTLIHRNHKKNSSLELRNYLDLFNERCPQ